MTDKIKLIIAEDHQILMDGMVSLLKENEAIQILGKALNGKQARQLVEEHQSALDLIILDIQMPEEDGASLSKWIKKTYPHIKILILSMFNTPAYVLEMVKLNVDGYILKEEGGKELISAIHKIHRGDEYFSKEVEKTLKKGLRNPNITGEIKLTKRETEVLKLIGQGLSTPQISELLNIKGTTVDTHRGNLIGKIGVDNSKGLIRYAIEKGFVE